jgi:hypothetical protein
VTTAELDALTNGVRSLGEAACPHCGEMIVAITRPVVTVAPKPPAPPPQTKPRRPKAPTSATDAPLFRLNEHGRALVKAAQKKKRARR